MVGENSNVRHEQRCVSSGGSLMLAVGVKSGGYKQVGSFVVVGVVLDGSGERSDGRQQRRTSAAVSVDSTHGCSVEL